MTRAILYLVFLCCSETLLFGQKDNVSIGGRSAAIGNASVTLADFWAVHNNQAAMAYYKKIAAGVYYENRFLTKETGLKCLAVVVPIKKAGVIGLNLSNFGYSLYNESKIGLAYAMAFGDHISAGLQLDYIYTHIGDNYGNKGLLTFEVGLRAKIIKELVLAVHVFNPANLKLVPGESERIPLIYKVGLSYSFKDKALIAAEVEKDMNFKPVFKVGAEYKVAKPVFLRIGIATNPMLYSFGAGFEFYHFKLDISASRHPQLGFSPQASLTWEIHSTGK
jgi:hypothetical protein